MPVYEYTALDMKGKNATGIVDAESASMARQKLRAMQKFPVSINEVADLSKQKTKQTPSVASSLASPVLQEGHQLTGICAW